MIACFSFWNLIFVHFLKADVKKAIQNATVGHFKKEASESDDSDCDVEQPDWMELIALTVDFNDTPGEFNMITVVLVMIDRR